jgi:hypothetical protein
MDCEFLGEGVHLKVDHRVQEKVDHPSTVICSSCLKMS